MTCAPDPKLSAIVVVHHFGVGAEACDCGQVPIPVREVKPPFNQQVYGKGGRRPGRKKKS